MSERVRYFLENSVKEIQDLKKRGIFDQDEITKIMKRRTDYEHRLISRGAKARDFLTYANYEQKVDRLRELRLKRLRNNASTSKVAKSGVSDWAGQRRITYILERGTKKAPGDLSIWRALIDHAKAIGAINVVNKSLISMLRLHPTNPGVWVYVAKYQAEENSAISEARAVLQRGLRFNADSEYLWLEYMRLELIYVAKILARRRLLGIATAVKEEHEAQTSAEKSELTALDIAAAETEIKNLPDVNIDVLGDVSSNPALRGDVALAVFDAGYAVAKDKVAFSLSCLQLFDQFDDFIDRQYLCSHVIEHTRTTYPEDSEVALWSITLPLRYVDHDSKEAPDQLRLLINLYGKSNKSLELKEKLRNYLAEKFPSDADPSLLKAVQLFSSRL